MEKETAALRKSLTAQKEKVRGREKSKMRLGLSPEGCPKQEKKVFLKKSHRYPIIFKKTGIFAMFEQEKIDF